MLRKVRGGGALQPVPTLVSIIRGLVGGVLGILLLMYLTKWTGTPWIMAPFGATCVLLFALPNSPLAQPRSVIGGHLLSSFIGLLFINLLGESILSVSLAVGCSIAAMQAFRVIHAPAGADPIVVILSGIYGFDFLLSPVLIGSVALVLVGIVVNNIGKDLRWPQYWLGAKPAPITIKEEIT